MSIEPKTLRDGRYVLVRKLGEGSQGETFEATAVDDRKHPRDKRLADEWSRYLRSAKTAEAKGDPATRDVPHVVAIKSFRLGKAKAWKDVELAEREATTLATLDHPHLPKYIEHFEEDGALYLVMEKIEGESVAALRAKKRTWTIAEITRMLEDIGEALRYLQGRSPFIVHRDIKPGNVIRRPDGSFALVDFGAVRDRLKPTGGSTVVGTFGYMAPEQFQGRASPKSDLYGLGATALAMLTGEEPEDLPHEGLGIDVRRAVPRGTPTPLVRALGSMLAPDPDRRVDSIDAALAFLADRPAVASSPSPPPLLSHPSAPPKLTKGQKRDLRNQKRREAHADRKRKRAARAAARERSVPFLPRLAAKLGLFVALLVVWILAGVVAPIVLFVLSFLFGGALRRAANASVRGAMSAQRSLGRASDWLSGERTEGPSRARIATDLDRVRAVTESEAQAIAIAEAESRGHDADAWLDERLEHEQQRLEAEELEAVRRKRAKRQP